MAITLLEAGTMARVGSGGDDGAPMGGTTGGTKSMRAQKLQLNRDKSEPCDVYSWFEITLKSIDVPSQTFDCSIEVHLFWQDFNLPNIFPEFEKEDFTIDDDDVPVKMSEIFENKLSADLEGDPVFQYFPDTGTIYMMFVCECTFVERMELQRFPLDRQFLNMEFNAWVSEGNWNWTLEPGLDWVPKDFRDREFAVRMVSSITEYECLGPWIDFTSDQPLSIRLRVNRIPTYYFGNIVFPNFLIVAGCFAAFAVPRTEVADRLSVTVTLMLAAVAFRFVVSTMLPKVSYLTIMDKYLLIGFIALIILIAENGFAGLGFIENDTAFWIDWIFGIIFGFLWILIHVVATIALVFKDFYRISWEEMDRIDSEEDPDAEFVKAEAKYIKTPDESEFCKEQWAQSRLKSPTTRAKDFEELHPELAEKNRSQFDEDPDEAPNATPAETIPEVPSKAVGSKLSDLDLEKKPETETIVDAGTTTGTTTETTGGNTQSNMETAIAISNNNENDNQYTDTNANDNNNNDETNNNDQTDNNDENNASGQDLPKNPDHARTSSKAKSKPGGYAELEHETDNEHDDNLGNANEAIERVHTNTDVVYDGNDGGAQDPNTSYQD